MAYRRNAEGVGTASFDYSNNPPTCISCRDSDAKTNSPRSHANRKDHSRTSGTGSRLAANPRCGHTCDTAKYRPRCNGAKSDCTGCTRLAAIQCYTPICKAITVTRATKYEASECANS